jgi:hypothetical protein
MRGKGKRKNGEGGQEGVEGKIGGFVVTPKGGGVGGGLQAKTCYSIMKMREKC